MARGGGQGQLKRARKVLWKLAAERQRVERLERTTARPEMRSGRGTVDLEYEREGGGQLSVENHEWMGCCGTGTVLKRAEVMAWGWGRGRQLWGRMGVEGGNSQGMEVGGGERSCGEGRVLKGAVVWEWYDIEGASSQKMGVGGGEGSCGAGTVLKGAVFREWVGWGAPVGQELHRREQ
jgi:hypothetical protein